MIASKSQAPYYVARAQTCCLNGFGSLNVKEAVNKYGGNITYKASEESFLVEIIFSDIIIN